MKPCLLTALLLLLALPAFAQTPAPRPAPAPPGGLQLEEGERRFFALGTTLAGAGFAYAELAKQAQAVSRTRSKIAQVAQLGKLAPLALRNRRTARDAFAQASALMRTLDAPPDALAPVARAAARLDKPLPLSHDARPLAIFNGEAAFTLSALKEFDLLSSLPEDPALRRWLLSPQVPASAQVWYGEGEIAGLAQIAAAHEMPDLLPPAEQLATDLRGLRDWLAGRLPDAPTPEQISLKNALEAFLEQSSLGGHPGRKSQKPLTPAQLQALGEISRQLQAQVLGPPAGGGSAPAGTPMVGQV